jgi:hypothetical protein
VKRYAEAEGFHPEKAHFAWGEGKKEGIGRMEVRMTDTLLGNRGVVAT